MSANPYALNAELPWSPDDSENRRLRKITLGALALALLLGAVVPLLPVTPREQLEPPEVSPRLAKLIERRQPPPPPKPKVVKPELPPPPPKAAEAPKPEVKPKPAPKQRLAPTPQVAKARERASNEGVLAFRNALADLRQDESVAKLEKAELNTGGSKAAKAERALIASKVATGSGGIDTAKLSRNTGGAGGGKLSARKTTTVKSSVGGTGAAATASRAGGKPDTRSDKDIQQVFDRNKSAIYALYNRALRTNSGLRGTVMLRLTISPDGSVTDASIVSSDLGDADLERKIVLRVKRLDFGPSNGGPVTIKYPIQFFPS